MSWRDEGARRARVASATRWTLAFALGVPLPDEPVPWDDVLAVAEREGLAPLCWMRAAAVIRRRAPRDVADAFRARTLAVAHRAQHQLRTLDGVLRTLEDADAAPVALKGGPLAQLAHGDPFVRQSADVDVLVPRPARERARLALERAGWRCVAPAAPWEETWLRGQGDTLEHLEVQSAPFGEMLVHLEPSTLPVGRLVVDGVAVSVLAPVVLPSYLAVHLSRHRLAPLLWFVDLAALWATLPADVRADADRFALRQGTEAYLRWALSRADMARAVAEGDLRRLPSLGRVGAHGRAIGHPAWRDLRFAPDVRGATRVAMAWAVPPTTRGSRASVLARVRRRARRLLGGTPGQAARRDPAGDDARSRLRPAGARSLDVSREELGDLVETVAGAGGAVWLRVRGRSMQPAIPSESLVRLVPPPDRPLRAGEVALARLPDGSFALHRVLDERDGRVVLRGDAVVLADPPVPRSAVLACADLVDRGDGAQPVSAREPVTAFRLLRPLRHFRVRLRARELARSGASEGAS